MCELDLAMHTAYSMLSSPSSIFVDVGPILLTLQQPFVFILFSQALVVLVLTFMIYLQMGETGNLRDLNRVGYASKMS